MWDIRSLQGNGACHPAPFGAGPLPQVPQFRHAAAAALLPLLLLLKPHTLFQEKKRQPTQSNANTGHPAVELVRTGGKGEKKRKSPNCSELTLAAL